MGGLLEPVVGYSVALWLTLCGGSITRSTCSPYGPARGLAFAIRPT